MPEPILRRPGDVARIRNPVGGNIVFALRGDETSGSLTALETIAAPDEGPPFHTHAHEDECLVVLEGTVRFRLREDVQDAPAGSFVYVPRGVPHTWENAGTRLPGCSCSSPRPGWSGSSTASRTRRRGAGGVRRGRGRDRHGGRRPAARAVRIRAECKPDASRVQATLRATARGRWRGAGQAPLPSTPTRRRSLPPAPPTS